MATDAELKEEYLILQQQLKDINDQITAVIKTKNKKYLYSNQETTHSAELQDLKALQDMKKDIKQQMTDIENILSPVFFQFKTC